MYEEDNEFWKLLLHNLKRFRHIWPWWPSTLI